jgi:ATP-dependent Clp protease ATP-binding subunit ClpA
LPSCSCEKLLLASVDHPTFTTRHQLCSWPRRFLPDKAIDLIDEAGSRVRLRHAQLPEEARDLDKELRALLKEKEAAVR